MGAVSSLLTDPESLKCDREAMSERGRKAHSDPESGAKTWAATHSEVEPKRDKYRRCSQSTLDNLRAKLYALEETREPPDESSLPRQARARAFETRKGTKLGFQIPTPRWLRVPSRL